MKLHEWQAQQAVMKALKIKHASLKAGASPESAEVAAEKFLDEAEKREDKKPESWRGGA